MRRRMHASPLAEIFQSIRRDEELPVAFPAAVLDEARRARPAEVERGDLRHIPFLTIDPPDARDLDQAMALEPLPNGAIRVRYAIADVASFVTPGGPIDVEARRRGTTVYCPDRNVPLHPTDLSEDAASLLPDRERPAVVFEIDVDGDGDVLRSDVRRAIVRSRQRLDYSTVQEGFARGDPPEPVGLLERFGRARIEKAVGRGAIDLRLPEQEIERRDGRWQLLARQELAVERWNAEVSLLTGMVAAEMMVGAGIGILRTLPAATPEAIGMLRGAAKGLGIAWSRDETASEVLSGLDASQPRQHALFEHATRILRGSGYLGFVGGPPVGDYGHAGVAAVYSHVTAPLRRLVDRFSLTICVALAAGDPVPGWVLEAIDEIPGVMEATATRANRVESRCVDAVEAWVLRDHLTETFPAVVVSSSKRGAEVWIDEPPILTWIDGLKTKAGKVITVEVVAADPGRGNVKLEMVA